MQRWPTLVEDRSGARPVIRVLDQTLLPRQAELVTLDSLESAARAIRVMQVRGAPLIGVTAAYGVALGLLDDASDEHLQRVVAMLGETRPTAVNLHWALMRMLSVLQKSAPVTRHELAWQEARRIAEEDVLANRTIGEHGKTLFASPGLPGRPLRVMTHCNAGRLATVDHGTALAPIYALHAAGRNLHVWVSETRPRNQGLLTAWELAEAGVPHTLIADNAAGLLMLRGQVDAVIVGADRIAANGDVANKVGTYLKALAAQASGIPFYVAAPCSTIDFACPAGADIPIEERAGEELGTDVAAVTTVHNPAFDITPASLVTAIISERGVAAPDCLGQWRSA